MAFKLCVRVREDSEKGEQIFVRKPAQMRLKSLRDVIIEESLDQELTKLYQHVVRYTVFRQTPIGSSEIYSLRQN